MSAEIKKYGRKFIAVLMALVMFVSFMPVSLITFAVEDDETTSSQASEPDTDETTTSEPDETTTSEPVPSEPDTDETTTAVATDDETTTSEPTTEKSTFDVTVNVVDSEGNPISHATVTDANGEKLATTDSEGKATFSQGNEGEVTIIAEKKGYNSVKKTVSVSAESATINVTLYKYYTYKGEVVYPVDIAEESKGFTVKVEVVNGNDENQHVAEIDGDKFEIQLVENVEYKITVNPNSDKLLSKSEKTVESEEGEKTYNLEYIEYTIYLGDDAKGTAIYGEEFEIDLKQEGVVLSEETTVISGGTSIKYETKNTDNNIISFIVVGTTVITPSYNYSFIVSSDENGTVTIGQTEVTGQEEVSVIISNKEEIKYSVKAKPGYRIDTVVFNDETIVQGNNSMPQVSNKILTTSGELKATFVPVKCTVTVNLVNSKTGKATLSYGDWSISVPVNSENIPVKGSFEVGIDEFNKESKEYTIILNETIDENHFIEIEKSNDFSFKYADGKYTIVTKKLDIEVNASVSAKEYTINYVNPLAKVESEKFTVEREAFELPAPEVKGYKFLGWTYEAPDMITSSDDVITTFDCEAQSGDVTLYAVYVIDTVNITAKSTQTFDDNTKELTFISDAGEIDDKISDEYFGNDVELFVNYDLEKIEDGKLTATITAEDEEEAKEFVFENSEIEFVIGEKIGASKSTDVTVAAKIEFEVDGETFVYASSPDAEFVVNQDDIAPTLMVSKKSDRTELDFSDEGSGVFAVQFAIINTSTATDGGISKLLECVQNGTDTEELESETIADIKAALRKIDTWKDLEPEALGTAVHQLNLNDNEYPVYRVVDKAGNDIYSSFDRTVPEVTDIKYAYSDSSSDKPVVAEKGNIYTNGDVRVTATVVDKYLFNKNNNKDKYADCKLYVTYYENGELKRIEFDTLNSIERLSLFNDKWDVEFMIDKETIVNSELADRELDFEIVAYDQAGNISEAYGLDGKMIIETVSPEIKVEYGYINHDETVTAGIDKETTVYSMDKVVVYIEVSGEFFDPYVDSNKSSAQVEVLVNDETYKCEFTKSENGWKTSFILEEQDEYNISVKATSQAGNVSEYVSGTVIIDSTAPEIDVSYNLKNAYEANGAIYYGVNNENSTFTIKVEDTYLAPFYGDESDASTVSASLRLEGTDEVLILEKEDFKYDGSYTATADVFEKEGTYELSVVVTDQAGKTDTYNMNLHVDTTVPEITNISIEEAHKLSFGNFFNKKVILTVVCNDGTNTYSSGCREVVLNYGAEEPAISAVVDNKATFELPLEDIENWGAELSVLVIDNVNNESNEIKIDELNGDEILTDYVLYEKDAPVVTSPFDTSDENVFYVEDVEGENTYWLLKDESITFEISDVISQDLAYSGLDNVNVTLENDKATVIGRPSGEQLDRTQVKVATERYEFGYDDLAEGKNVFTVTAIDNAGNEMTTVSYVVYKDIEAPSVTDIVLAAEGEESAGNNLKFGNFYNGDISLNISSVDEAFSSGIASINVYYVINDRESFALEEIDAPSVGEVEEKSDVSGEQIIFERKFNLGFIENAEGYFEIEIVDNVGNAYSFGSKNESLANKVGGNLTINHLMFEKASPNIALSASDPVFECELHAAWYNTDDITISSDVSDIVGRNATSGLNKFTMSLNGDIAIEKTLGKEISNSEMTTNDESEINLSGCGDDNKLKAVDGENVITVSTTDNASNTSTDEIRVCVDRVNPMVSAFSFKRVGESDEYVAEKCSTVTVTDYGYYFAEDTEVTVYVKDSCPSSGIKEIHFSAIPVYSEYNGLTLTKIINDVSTACATECKFKDSTEGGSVQTSYATFVVPAGFKGQVYAYVVDNVGNDSLGGKDVNDHENWKHPHGLIVETQQMHDSHESIAKHITIAEKTTPVRYLDGDKNPLYNDNAELTITVIDTYSGIKNVEYTVESAYDTGNNYGATLQNIVPGGEMLEGWEYSTELNLVTTMRKTITVANNSNDIVVNVKMTDNSGNTSQEQFVLSIDKDAPIITVTFDKAEAHDDDTYVGFFNSDRRMKVSILERNFDPEQVLIVTERDFTAYNISSTSISNYAFGPNDKNVDGANIQFYEYVLVHDFTEDGDYEFAMEVTDLANNKTKDQQVNYGSAEAKEVAKKFTIDKTTPVITVSISGTESNNSFYSDNLAFTVAIEEHNFADERYRPQFVVKKPVTEEIIGMEIPAPAETHANDIHTYTYSFTKEYTYELQMVDVIDMAGNEAKDDTVYVASLDLTAPEIQINYSASNKNDEVVASNQVLDRVATNAAVFKPIITISDAYLNTASADHYSMSLTGNYNGNVLGDSNSSVSYTVGSESDTSNNVYISTISFNNFEAKEEIDDIYTLRVTAKDQAGRVSEKTVVFSVNRFGSTFMVDTATSLLLDRYYTNTEQNVKLIQINAAEIEDSRITKTKDGVSTDLKSGNHYEETKSSPSNLDGSSGTSTNWYECVYDIDGANFEEEGMYGITVYTADSAENSISSVVSKRTINLFAEKKPADATVVDDESLDAPVNFLVDKTNPTTSISGLDKDQYFSGSHEIVYYANDDVKLAVVELYDTSDETASWENLTCVSSANGEQIKNGVTYTIEEKDESSIHYITVVAKDMAGNIYASDTISVQVTTNPIEWFLENAIAKMIAAVLLVAAVVVIIILIKRKKEKEKDLEYVQ